uniref:Uncharacterized protein n=1 Tax=Ditylenchus dipsaci TaxID=166011 RepID=A0A915E3G6_9BILA
MHEMNDSHQFSIEEKTGVVGYSGSPSFLPSSTTLVVHASQVDRPERNASAVLVITNINASSFSSVVNQQQSQHSVILFRYIRAPLPSNCPKGRRILQLPVRNSTYQLLEASRLPFSISQDGVLTVIGVLHKPEYHLAVEVDDGGSQQKIEVNVMVYPSLVTGPEFGEQEYVFELDPLEAMLGRVQAHSYANQLGDQSLFYTLLNANEDFEMDAEGVLTTRKQPKEKRYTEEIIQELIGMVEDVQAGVNTGYHSGDFSVLSPFSQIWWCSQWFAEKKIVEIYQSKRGCSIGSEWMGGCPPGVTITSPISTSDMMILPAATGSINFD